MKTCASLDGVQAIDDCVATAGQTTQNATYTYDGAGRLSQVNDAVNGLETYTWNADGTLASMPRPGYTALMNYDEEGRLTGIQHSVNGNTTPAYQYGYGADGGRRWRKDIAGNVWTWYPCGVACGAGGLVEKQSDLTGQTWATSAQLLRGTGLVSRVTSGASEYHLPDINGVNSVITGGNGNILSSNVYDKFGVTQASQGSAVTPYRYGQAEEEGMSKLGNADYLPNLSTSSHKPTPAKPLAKPPRTISPCGGFTSGECVAAYLDNGYDNAACVAFCKIVKNRSCDWLYNQCMLNLKHGKEKVADMCMAIYLTLCSGE